MSDNEILSTSERLLRADTSLNDALAEITDLIELHRNNPSKPYKTEIYALKNVLDHIRDARLHITKAWPPP